MSNQAALLKKPHDALTVESLEIPKPGPEDLLVKNHAIAINPVDWKMRDYNVFVQNYPAVLGSDIAGTVESVGSSVTRFKAGDRVTGFADALASGNLQYGAFQQYTLVKACATTKLPDNTTFEEASILPMSVATSAVGIFLSLEVPRPPTNQSGGFLVWGASSSVGSAAVQMVKSLGYTVYAVCNTRNHAYVKELGADACFDYNDTSIVKTIVNSVKGANQKLNLAFDAVSEHGTAPQAAAVLEALGGGKLCLTLPYPDDAKKPDGVEIVSTFAARVTTDQKEFGEWLFGEWLAQGLAKGTYKPSPTIEKVKGGLEAVQGALDAHKQGVSGKKLVLTLKN